ncbi:MAG TPA: isocitrate lyase/PEP mutase family protein [Chloroflexota bacterium]|nr:isocitrate lyase/PEP mutase family protein [Chloroflexota bacterium]
MPERQSKGARLRELLKRPELLVMPGGFSPLLAHMTELAGFEAFFLAGSQTSAFLYGLPDVGIIGLRDMVDHARHVAARCDIPVFVDADTGFGNAVGVHFTVQEYIRAGAAALHIEDQEAPKKSGTGAGRRCISTAEAIGKYKAAVAARDEFDPEFVVCARCDLVGAEGGTFEGAVDRCVAYVEEGGVDMVWINTLESREQIERACRRIPAPVLPAYGGPSPSPTLDEWQSMGAAMAIFPALTTAAALQASWDILHDFKARGTPALADLAQRSKASPWGAADRTALVGSDLIRELEERYLPQDVQRDYQHTHGYTDRPAG